MHLIWKFIDFCHKGRVTRLQYDFKISTGEMPMEVLEKPNLSVREDGRDFDISHLIGTAPLSHL